MDDDCAAFKTEASVEIAKMQVSLENIVRSNSEANQELMRLIAAAIERVGELERENKSVARQVIAILGAGLAATVGVLYHNLSGGGK